MIRLFLRLVLLPVNLLQVVIFVPPRTRADWQEFWKWYFSLKTKYIIKMID